MFPSPAQPYAFDALMQQASSDDGGPNWFAWAFVALILIGLVLYAWGSWRSHQPFRIEGSTSLPVDVASDQVIEGYVRSGWSSTPLSDGRVLFARTTGPEIGTVIFLALFFILPALVYMVSSRKQQTAELRLEPLGRQGTAIEITGNTTGFGGVQTAAKILRSLPKS